MRLERIVMGISALEGNYLEPTAIGLLEAHRSHILG